MKYLTLLLILLSVNVLAEEVCWTGPTHNTDDSLIEEELTYGIYHGRSSGAYTELILTTPPEGSPLCHEVPLPTGVNYVAMTATHSGGESAKSNEVQRTVSAGVPPLPPMVTQTERQVFTVIKQPDRFILLPIGTVPSGTQCSGDQSINGHQVVPNEDVVWTSATGPRPIVVVARCSG